MSTLQQNLQRPFYIKHLLERLRYGKAAVAMRREAADLIEKMNEDSSNLSAQNSYQAMRIEELQRDLAAAQEEMQKLVIATQKTINAAQDDLAVAQSELASVKAHAEAMADAIQFGDIAILTVAKAAADSYRATFPRKGE